MSLEVNQESSRLLSLDAYRGFVMLAMASGGIGTFGILESSGDSTWSLLHRLSLSNSITRLGAAARSGT